MNIDDNESIHTNDYNTTTPTTPLHAENTALVIVDVQPEYWSGCPEVSRDFPAFPEKLQTTIELCRQRNVKIIWVRAEYNHSQSPWLSQFQKIRGNRNLGSIAFTPEWEPFATPTKDEVILTKSSWSSTTNTPLVDLLRTAGITNVLVCGLITSVCVQHSAFGLFEAGFRTSVVPEACADRGRKRHDAALALYGDYMYDLRTTHDLASTVIPAERVCQKHYNICSRVPINTAAITIANHSLKATFSSMISMSSRTNSISSDITTSSTIGSNDDDDDEHTHTSGDICMVDQIHEEENTATITKFKNAVHNLVHF